MTKGVTARNRQLVYNRDSHTCAVINSKKYPCKGNVLTVQHRVGKGSGGSSLPYINQPQNLVTFCYYHNSLIETSAEFKKHALANGWSIPRNRRPVIDPCDIPVQYPDGVFKLTPDGQRVPVLPAEALEIWSTFGLIEYGEVD